MNSSRRPMRATSTSSDRSTKWPPTLPIYDGLINRLYPSTHNGHTAFSSLPPAIQHLPPDIALQRVQSPPDSLSDKDREVDNLLESMGPVNYQFDVGLSEQQLTEISTRDLNRLLKRRNIGKERTAQLKQTRRTLKNRGYASVCRVNRMKETMELEVEIDKLKREIASMPLPSEYYLRIRQLKDFIRLIGGEDENSSSSSASSGDEEDVKSFVDEVYGNDVSGCHHHTRKDRGGAAGDKSASPATAY